MAKNKKIFTTTAKFNEYLNGGQLTADDICIIQDVKKVYINGIYLDGNETDLSDYLTADEIAEVYATKASLKTVATSGSYNDLSDKPTIPSAVTESTVSGWGFTKNTGTYSKPSGGIPKTDLASVVQTSLGKADTALQSHQDISGKQDKLVSGTNIKTINGESILGSGDIVIDSGGDTALMCIYVSTTPSYYITVKGTLGGIYFEGEINIPILTIEVKVGDFITITTANYLIEEINVTDKSTKMIHLKTHDDLGTFILGVSGTLYTADVWNGQEEVVGIALLYSDSVQFVIALDEFGYAAWGLYGGDIIPGSGSSYDMNGIRNTDEIIDYIISLGGNPEGTAAYLCRSYKFPNGKDGYLMACGQFGAIVSNLGAINDCLEVVGGTEINISSYYWTSTGYSKYSSIAYSPNLGIDYLRRDSSAYTRAITTY